jgi:hypothetical protein
MTFKGCMTSLQAMYDVLVVCPWGLWGLAPPFCLRPVSEADAEGLGTTISSPPQKSYKCQNYIRDKLPKFELIWSNG